MSCLDKTEKSVKTFQDQLVMSRQLKNRDIRFLVEDVENVALCLSHLRLKSKVLENQNNNILKFNKKLFVQNMIMLDALKFALENSNQKCNLCIRIQEFCVETLKKYDEIEREHLSGGIDVITRGNR